MKPNSKIIIGNKTRTLFYLANLDSQVIITPEEDRAERFYTVEQALTVIEKQIKPYNQWRHEYNDAEMKEEDMVVWSYYPTIIWEQLE